MIEPAAVEACPAESSIRPCFDAAIAWDRLSPEQRKRIGIAALVGAYARAAAMHVDNRAGIGFEAAEYHANAVLADLLGPLVLRPDGTPPLPNLSPLGIRSCRRCGCTDECGCPEGCSWVADDLCSSCDTRIGGLRPW